MRAPIDVAVEARKSVDEDGGAALALEVVERLEEARKVSSANRMPPEEVATCLEQARPAPLPSAAVLAPESRVQFRVLPLR